MVFTAVRTQTLPVSAMFMNGSGRNKQYVWRTVYTCILPSFGALGQTVSYEKIFLEIGQSEKRIGCGDHICYGIETKLTISIENFT
jgi:hypothetical protein